MSRLLIALVVLCTLLPSGPALAADGDDRIVLGAGGLIGLLVTIAGLGILLKTLLRARS